jgi:hypothetical protein
MYEDNMQMNESEAAQFATFLQSLDGLLDFTMDYNLAQQIFLTSDFGNSVKFQLQKFHITMNPPPHRPTTTAGGIAYDNLCNFIDKQRTALTYLIILRSTLSSAHIELLMSLNIKKLFLNGCTIQLTRPISIQNSSIRKLSISEDDGSIELEQECLCELINSCTKLKSINLFHMEVLFEPSLAVRKHPNKIEKVKMHECTFFPVTVPSLRTLEISNPIDEQESVYLVRLNPQLKKLRVPGNLQRFPTLNRALDELDLDVLVIT